MRMKAKELIFISQINRDGSGTTPVSESFLEGIKGNRLMRDEEYDIICLSMSENTYIAHGVNSFVVRIKN
jgi:hypothetical protein